MSEIRQHELLNKMPEPTRRQQRLLAKSPAAQESTIVFVRIAPGFSADDLASQGYDVRKVYGDIALVNVPYGEIEQMATLDCVKLASIQRQLHTRMDLARAEQGVDLIHSGSQEAGLSVPYTGKGVVTGIIDQGVDPHHINFRYANGQSRIEALWWWRMSNQGEPVSSFYNYTTIGDFATDTPTAYHGTHTLGIMAGSYNGPVTVAKPLEVDNVPQTPTLVTEDCRYYGVAPQASIAVSCGDLQDGFIAYGMEDILNFAEWLREEDPEHPWPLVWNLSLGGNQGPHDKNTMLNTVLNEFGKHGIVCVSAGNEGDLKISLKKEFTQEDKSVKTMIYPYGYQYDPDKPDSQTMRAGSIAIYSDDATPFQLKAVIYNRTRGYRAAKNMGVVGDNIGTYYCSSTDYQMADNDVVGDANFCRAFIGYVGVGTKLDEETGRYYGMVDYYVTNNPQTNLDDNYVLGFEVTGEPGHRIECYGDAQNTWMDSYGVAGFTDGSTDGTISDMAVADNLIVIGSYNTRNQWVCLDGGRSRYEGDGFQVGGVSGFSSYGTLSDGRSLPTVCAPGAAIISSVSYPFIKSAAEYYGEDYINLMCQAKLEEDGRVNYWKQEVGTSMSTPFVAGSIALWLEANPDLDVDAVKEIIARTSIRDEHVNSTAEQTRWGAGKFNALAGLKEAIRMAGTQGVSAETTNDRLIVSREGDRNFRLFLGNASSMDVNVYTTGGALVLHNTASGDEASIDLSQLESGIYVISVNGRHNSKIALK